jgi:hypothetical protein
MKGEKTMPRINAAIPVVVTSTSEYQTLLRELVQQHSFGRLTLPADFVFPSEFHTPVSSEVVVMPTGVGRGVALPPNITNNLVMFYKRPFYLSFLSGTLHVKLRVARSEEDLLISNRRTHTTSITIPYNYFYYEPLVIQNLATAYRMWQREIRPEYSRGEELLVDIGPEEIPNEEDLVEIIRQKTTGPRFRGMWKAEYQDTISDDHNPRDTYLKTVEAINHDGSVSVRLDLVDWRGGTLYNLCCFTVNPGVSQGYLYLYTGMGNDCPFELTERGALRVR